MKRMKIFTFLKFNLLLGILLAINIPANAFQAEGYEWEIIGEDRVRCDGFVWNGKKKIADIPASVTNPATNKTYTTTDVGGIKNCEEVEEIIVPETVNWFGDGTFSWNPNLKRIKLPTYTNMVIMPEAMFKNCTSLKELTTPKAHIASDGTPTWIQLEKDFCYGCTSLRKVIIPTECARIEDGAFQKCPNLQEFHIYSVNPPTLGDYVFYSEQEMSTRHRVKGASNMTLYVPQGSAESYKASSWGKYFTEIKEVSDLSGITNIDSDVNTEDAIQVFDINGCYVSDSIDGLVHGLYIIKQGSKTRKIIL